MIFKDRREAGRMLAKKLKAYAHRDDVIVLGVPRGGVLVAFEVAQELQAPLDVFVLRKLGVPGHEELAFGAIAGGIQILDDEVIDALHLSPRQIELTVAQEKSEMERREKAYRGGRPALALEGKAVLLIDDGIATGSSIRAGIRALRRMRPARIVVATPVAPVSTCKRLRAEVDELVCPQESESFFAIGQFYEDFSQLRDEEVVKLLRHAAPASSPGTRVEKAPVRK